MGPRADLEVLGKIEKSLRCWDLKARFSSPKEARAF
jgi:hypothetical protein